jgi:MYXO-CTERM domain-containing protein
VYDHGSVRLVTLLTIGVLAAPAGAQSININIGTTGAPSSSYAAAGAAGTWNNVTGVAGPTFDFVALDGSPSGVTATQTPTTTLLTGTDPSVSGDDAKLLNSGLVTTSSSAETCLNFLGFAPDTYEVLIYAWVPNQPTVKSRTRQDEAPTTIDVGGAWPGSHAEGVTFARYVVTVDSSGALPAHSGLAPGQPSAALNGIQIRPTTAAAGDAGISDPGDAGTTDPHHGGGCSTGGGGGLGLAIVALGLVRRRRSR